MDPAAIFTLCLIVFAAVTLVSERLRPDLIALLVMVILGLSGVTSPEQTFAGFGGSAVMTILGISIISESLRQTGITRWLGTTMYRISGQREWQLILSVTLFSAFLSLFMNNIAAVGVLLPATMTLARQSRVSPSRLLLPLAYGTLLGGMATLLTTSNIIVSGALRDAGFVPFGLLDFLPIGAPIVLLGTLYLLLIGRRWLPASPDHQSSKPKGDLAFIYNLDKTTRVVEVLPNSPFVSQSIAQGHLSQRIGATVIGLIRDNRPLVAPAPNLTILPGDQLILHGQFDSSQFEEWGLAPIPADNTPPLTSDAVTLAEVLIKPHSTLDGRTLEQIHFRDKYHVNVLAIWRDDKAITANLSKVPLRSGDALLIQGATAHIHLFSQEPDVILITEEPDAVIRPQKQLLATVITLISLTVAALGYLPVAIVVLAGAVLLILTQCVDIQDAYKAIEWKAIFLIAGMWPLSTAIRITGLADQITKVISVLVGHATPLMLAAILIALAFILTQLMSGQVAALVLAPLALATASQLGIDPHGYGMAVALGCSLAFPTPFGHPVNIMVMNPAGYTLKDYLRVGTPLTILTFFLILLGLKLFWGL
ncbi:MAG: SLC13 family permease [Anaerolineales bacterium]